jgi:hypothetical protein
MESEMQRALADLAAAGLILAAWAAAVLWLYSAAG